MAKFPLILPSDPAFYELPPPPGSEPRPSLEDMLAEAAAPESEDEEAEAREDDGDAANDPPVLAGSCDAHIHVFGDPERFPYRDGGDYRPKPAPADDYARLRRRLGLDRVVVVQSSAHGFDHGCLLDALAQLDGGPDGATGRARGVAAVGPAVSDGELRDLDAAGCVATRFQMRDPWRLIEWTETDRLAGRVPRHRRLGRRAADGRPVPARGRGAPAVVAGPGDPRPCRLLPRPRRRPRAGAAGRCCA